MSEASNPKRRRMNQPRPSGRPGSQGHAAWTECHGFGVACDKHGALGCGRGGRTIAVRLWFEGDFDVAVTGFVQSLILIPDTGCAIVAGLTRREEMSCFSCERSPIHARWHVFQAKVNRCDVICHSPLRCFASHWATPLQQEIAQLALGGEHDYHSIHRWVRIRESKRANGLGLGRSRAERRRQAWP